MAETSPQEITQLLVAWGNGDKEAFEKLLPLVHDELRRLARSYMKRERAGHILQTTALVNEAYLRLVDQTQVQWQNRAHFFAISAQMMRRILVTMARARIAGKRGGQAHQVTLDEAIAVTSLRDSELVALDDALDLLSELDPRRSRVVELRYFGGLSVEETATVLNISPETVMRDWKRARAWLYAELRKDTS